MKRCPETEEDLSKTTIRTSHTRLPNYPDDVVLPCTEADIDRVIRDDKNYLEDIYNNLANVLEGRVYEELKKQALKKEQNAGAVFPQMKIVC